MTATGLTISTIVRTGNVVTFRVAGGTSGQTYKATVRCGATDSETLEIDLLVKVTSAPTQTWTKQPDEIRIITFTFASELVTGDTLTGAATIDTPTATLAGVTGVPTVGVPAQTTTTVSALISAGDLGAQYVTACRCGTTLGDTLVIPVFLEIREVN